MLVYKNYDALKVRHNSIFHENRFYKYCAGANYLLHE